MIKFYEFETIDYPTIDDWDDATDEFGVAGPEDFDLLVTKVIKKDEEEEE